MFLPAVACLYHREAQDFFIHLYSVWVGCARLFFPISLCSRWAYRLSLSEKPKERKLGIMK